MHFIYCCEGKYQLQNCCILLCASNFKIMLSKHFTQTYDRLIFNSDYIANLVWLHCKTNSIVVRKTKINFQIIVFLTIKVPVKSISIFNTHVRYNSYVVKCINVYNDKILHVSFTGNAIVTVILFYVSLTGLNTWRQNVILGKRHTLICNLGFKLCQSIRNSLPVNYVEILW